MCGGQNSLRYSYTNIMMQTSKEGYETYLRTPESDEISYTEDNYVVMKSSTGEYSIKIYRISYYITGEEIWQEYFNGKS